MLFFIKISSLKKLIFATFGIILLIISGFTSHDYFIFHGLENTKNRIREIKMNPVVELRIRGREKEIIKDINLNNTLDYQLWSGMFIATSDEQDIYLLIIKALGKIDDMIILDHLLYYGSNYEFSPRILSIIKKMKINEKFNLVHCNRDYTYTQQEGQKTNIEIYKFVKKIALDKKINMSCINYYTYEVMS